MNIDEFKEEWQEEGKESKPVSGLDQLKSYTSPLAKLRRNILMEMCMLFVACVIIIWGINAHDYEPITQVVVWATSLIGALNVGLYYVQALKMYFQTSRLDLSQPKSVLNYIFNFKLSLAMYKVYNYSLMPFGLIMGLAVGSNGMLDHIYESYAQNGMNYTSLAIFLFGFVVVNLILYGAVNVIVKKFYGKHLMALEQVIEDMM